MQEMCKVCSQLFTKERKIKKIYQIGFYVHKNYLEGLNKKLLTVFTCEE